MVRVRVLALTLALCAFDFVAAGGVIDLEGAGRQADTYPATLELENLVVSSSSNADIGLLSEGNDVESSDAAFEDISSEGGDSLEFGDLWSETFEEPPPQELSYGDTAAEGVSDGSADDLMDGTDDIFDNTDTSVGHPNLRNGAHHARRASLANIGSAESMVNMYGDVDAAAAAATPAETHAAFPKQHPLVAQHLSSMDDKISALKEERDARENAIDKLELSTSLARRRMNDAIPMKQLMMRREADFKLSEKKIEELEEEGSRVEHRHDDLYEKLRAVMEPRLLNMQERLRRQKNAVEKAKENLHTWMQELQRYKTAATSELQTKQHIKESMQRAEEEAARADRAAVAAAAAYESEKAKAVQQVEAYKYILANYKGKVGKERLEENLENEDVASLDRMRNIYNVEKSRIEQSLIANKDRVAAKIKKARVARDQAQQALKEQRKKYELWRAQEKVTINEAAKRRAEYDVAQKAFADEREAVFDHATVRSGDQAVAENDWGWDDWAYEGEAPGQTAPEDSAVGPIHLD